MVAERKTLTAAEMLVALKEAQKKGVKTADLSEFDENGFKLVQDKAKLVGVALTVMQIEKGPHKTGRFEEYTIWAVTDAGVPVKFWDGSTGIMKQLDAYTGEIPFYVPKGLRVSTYTGRGGGENSTYYFDSDI